MNRFHLHLEINLTSNGSRKIVIIITYVFISVEKNTMTSGAVKLNIVESWLRHSLFLFLFSDKGWKRLFKNARAGSAANETLIEDQLMINNLKILKDFLREESKHRNTQTHAGSNDGTRDYLYLTEKCKHKPFKDAVHLFGTYEFL